jgi:preprotein translocase subunit SecA
MFPKLLTQIFGSRNDRLLKHTASVVEQINALEPQFEALDDAALRAKTDEFRERLAKGATAGRPAARGLRRGARSRQAQR